MLRPFRYLLAILIVIYHTNYCVCSGWFPRQEGWYPQLEIPKDDEAKKFVSSLDLSRATAVSLRQNTWLDFPPDNPPCTIIIRSKSERNNGGVIDIAYWGDSWSIDQDVTFRKGHIFVIPQHKPIKFIRINTSIRNTPIEICAFYESNNADAKIGEDSGSCIGLVSELKQGKLETQIAKYPRRLWKPIYPFFLTSKRTPNASEITVLSMATIDRMLRIRQIADMYAGPISVAIFIKNADVEIPLLINAWMESESMRDHMDIHLVLEDNIVSIATRDVNFPVNILRNVPLRYARTEHVFYIEADFIPNIEFYNSPEYHESIKLLKKDKNQIIVIAAFLTWNKQIASPKYDLREFPKNKEELIGKISKKRRNKEDIIPLNILFQSHRVTPYDKWLSKDGNTFSTLKARGAGMWEPYYLGSRDYPLFDEIMIGCGGDKIVHFEEMSRAGYGIKMMPKHFITHLDSTGMGKGWCNKQGSRFPKRATFKHRLERVYRFNEVLQKYVWWIAEKRKRKEIEIERDTRRFPRLLQLQKQKEQYEELKMKLEGIKEWQIWLSNFCLSVIIITLGYGLFKMCQKKIVRSHSFTFRR